MPFDVSLSVAYNSAQVLMDNVARAIPYRQISFEQVVVFCPYVHVESVVAVRLNSAVVSSRIIEVRHRVDVVYVDLVLCAFDFCKRHVCAVHVPVDVFYMLGGAYYVCDVISWLRCCFVVYEYPSGSIIFP